MPKKIILALAFAIASAAGAQASVIYPTGSTSFTPGANPGTGARSVIENAYAGPDGSFFSPGLGGEVVFSFSQAFTGDVTIWEATNGSRSSYVEGVKIYASADGLNWGAPVASILNNPGSATFSVAGIYRYLKVVDITQTLAGHAPAGDGFDIDAISATLAPIPVPAGAALMGGALLGMLGLRRSRKG